MAEFHQIAGYDVVGTLGQGAQSVIYSVRDKQGKPFCLKRVVKKSSSEQRYLDQAIREHEVAQVFDCPLLRKSYRLIKQRALLRVSEVLVVMEMVEGKTLEHMKIPNMEVFCRLFNQVALGLQTMHEAGYVHADLKPNNILVDSLGQVKLIDFGQSCLAGTVKERVQGTPDYIAPEQVYRKAITPRTDAFNMGATMYWLLTDTHVPTEMAKPSAEGMVQLRTSEGGKPPIELNASVPPALSSLVMEMVAREPRQRPQTMTAVMERLAMADMQARRAAGKPIA